METMTNALMEWETIDRDQVLEIMAGKANQARPQRLQSQ
jgi:ATP-dependent Zn protease